MEEKKRYYMTIQDYAKKIGVTRQTIYNRIKSGDIKPTKIGSQQLILIN